MKIDIADIYRKNVIRTNANLLSIRSFGKYPVKLEAKYNDVILRKSVWNIRLQSGVNFVSTWLC